MKLTEIQSVEALLPWCEQWDRLVQCRPMRSTAWLLGWWSRYASAHPSRQLSVWLFQQGDELVGIAPLYRTKVGTSDTLRFLGDGRIVCTDHTTWFAKAGFETPVAEAIAARLQESSEWSRLQLDSIDQVDPTMQGVLDRLQQSQYIIHSNATESCWKAPIAGSWDDYLGSVSKNHRKRCRKWSRGYLENGKVEIIEAGADNFEDVWQQLIDLHAARWGNAAQPLGSFSQPNFADFHKQLARELLDRDQARLAYLRYEGQAVAAEYQFMDVDTLYAYQSGISPRHSEISPGNISLVATIQFGIRRGLTSLDFLRGDEPYKSHWGAQPQACHTVRVWPNGLAGRVQNGFHQAKHLVAQWMNNSGR